MLVMSAQESRQVINEQRQFRAALGRFATGVTIVTTAHRGEVHGMTANGFMSVSLDPPLVVVSISKRARMHDVLKLTGSYGVNVLAREQEHLSQHFAGRPTHGLKVPFVDGHGAPLIAGSLVHVSARVRDAHDAGDHTLFVGEVDHFEMHLGEPLIFHSGGYRALVEAAPDPGHREPWDGFCLVPGPPAPPAGAGS
ncbi:MAG: putative monooxygenase NimA [Conexibacter sp.]|nr:putative monooxygenase NimA [Conexibacter sp.]